MITQWKRLAPLTPHAVTGLVWPKFQNEGNECSIHFTHENSPPLIPGVSVSVEELLS